MRRSRPDAPILVHANDIEAAFRRVIYHPDVAIAFAYVFGDYLIIPVGQVFGSRNAPSFYCVLADLREVLAAVRQDVSSDEIHMLVRTCDFQVDSTTPLVGIPPDSHHPPLSADEVGRGYHASYVDNNAVAAFAEHIQNAIHHSVMSAFEVFGADPRRGDPLQAKKWTSLVSESFMYLGFRINTHDMTVSWPLYKRQALHETLSEVIARQPRPFVTPCEMAKIVGVVRSASEVALWGNFLSFNLQNLLTTAARHAFSDDRSWWNRHKIFLSPIAKTTIAQLMATLLADDGSPLWTQPIAFLLDRDITHAVYSDASYEGIGGWIEDFSFLWRLTREVLEEAGCDMHPIHLKANDPAATGLHINPLEYIGAFINLWLTLKCVLAAGPIVGGYILALYADNTTALSWLSTAARTKNPLLQQGLARLGSALLVAASRYLTKVCPTHIPGDQNGETDALSRTTLPNSSRPNSLDYIIKTWSQLRTCCICLLPFSLLSTIASIISSPPTGDQYDAIMTDLLTLEPSFLPIGVRAGAYSSTIYED